MKRKRLAVGIILLLAGTCIISGIAQDTEKPLPTSRGNWLYVGGNGPGNYTTIQDAINDATDGDIVFVYDDSSPYIENLMINKGIYLRGENRYTTEIQPYSWDSTTITIAAQNASVRCFTIRTADMGVFISSSDNITIDWNKIINNHDGIYVSSSSRIRVTNNIFDLNHFSLSIGNSKKCTIDNNIFYPSPGLPNDFAEMKWPHYFTMGISGCNNNSIQGNTFIGELYYNSLDCLASKDNIISNNSFSFTPGDFDEEFSLAIWYGSERNRICNNSIAHGLSVDNSHHNTIQNNNFQENRNDLGISISLESSTQNVLFGNTIQSCHLSSCDNNSIYYNNIKAIAYVFDDGHNTWNLQYPSGGNHWNSHPGSDYYSGVAQNETGADGIGDIAYTIPGGDNQDRYPLVLPFGMTQLAFTNISGGFGLRGTITNDGHTTALRIYCRMPAKGGFVIMGQDSSQMILKPLLPGKSTIVNSQFILGFGKIQFTILVWADNAPIVSTKINGYLLLIFLIGVR